MSNGTVRRTLAKTKSHPGLGKKRAILHAPVEELLKEAMIAVKFVQTHAKTRRDASGGILERGLDLARDPAVGPRAAEELLAAIRVAQDAQVHVAEIPKRKTGAILREQARRLVVEIRRVCTHWAETEGTEKDRAIVAKFRKSFSGAATDARAEALEMWARLADEWSDRVRGLGGFDEGATRNARGLAAMLRTLPIERRPKEARLARDRALLDIAERVAHIRRVARFVFASQPEIVREVTSAYERNRKRRRPAVTEPKETPKSPGP